MKKTLLSIMLAMALPAFAQVAVPTSPTIPTMVTVSPNAVAALASATTNRVFIDQSGANPNVNMTQNGNGNIAGSAERPVYLRGIGQTIVTNQVGASNEINLEVVNGTTGSVGATVTIQQLGNSNKADVACGYGFASNGTTALTGCKSADINMKFDGNSNEMTFRGTGDDLKIAIDTKGNTNKFYMDVLGDKHTDTIKVEGSTNTFNISQRSTGAAGSSIWIDLNGASNTMTIAQSGTIDNVLNIKSVSTGGTFNITQKN